MFAMCVSVIFISDLICSVVIAVVVFVILIFRFRIPVVVYHIFAFMPSMNKYSYRIAQARNAAKFGGRDANNPFRRSLGNISANAQRACQLHGRNAST
jgi:hypothetical protein